MSARKARRGRVPVGRPRRGSAWPARLALVVGTMTLALSLPTHVRAVGLSAEALYSRDGIQRVLLSPTGAWAAAEASRGRVNGILAQRIGRPETVSVFATEAELLGIRWIGPDSLLASFASESGWQRVLVIRLEMLGARLTASKRWVEAGGRLVDPLPLEADSVLWEFDYDGRNSVYRLTIDELVTYGEDRDRRGRKIRPGERLATIRGTAHRWLVDRKGEPRVAWRRDDDGYSILYRKPASGSFEKVYAYSDDDDAAELVPVYLSADEASIVVFAYRGGDTLGLHTFDAESGEFGETLLRRSDVDVNSVLVDEVAHEIIAGGYEADGLQRWSYLAGYRERFAPLLGDAFPFEAIEVEGATPDRKLFLFRVASATEPGKFYVRDVAANRTIPVGSGRSQIDRDRLSPVDAFVVESADGTEVEAFLTRPRSSSRPAPLVVMPHGGPIGVRDRRVFDPMVQYLASWGFAVLQPNYRGSSGYGLEYRAAGKKQWARGIEDDIDAAVQHARALPEVDGSRLCIVGGSYGGFSALASVIRHKELYRCAISINGVSDIPLLYDSSDIADSKRSLAFYEEHVGDLETERGRLVDASPAYHVDEIEVPVFFIYGTEDRRVDPDHAHRMMLMLELFGREFESLEVEGMAHSPRGLEGVIVARAVRRNLTRYLEPSGSFVPDPPIEGSSSDGLLPRLRLGP